MPGEAAPRWTAGLAWRYGLLLFILDVLQSVALLPVLLRWMTASEVAMWASLTACLGLVNAAASAYSLPLVRALASRHGGDGLPYNQSALLHRADRTGLVLLLTAQLCLALWLAGAELVSSGSGWVALCVYFLAMQCRLKALNRFVWTNGLLQLGRDKYLLAQASAVTLVLALPLAAATGSVVGLAMSALAGSAWLLRQAVNACNSLRHNADSALIAWPARREMAALLLLNLAGYLNLGTDVLVANHQLPAAQAVSYAFWSRALLSVAMLVGLYSQIRFPHWPRVGAGALRAELRRGLLGLGALPLLAGLAYWGASSIPQLSRLCLLPGWVAWVMACTTALACGSLLAGQMSTARGAYAFLAPSAMLAACAPLAASAAAHWAGRESFVFGYLLVNSGLFAVNVASLWRSTSPLSPPATALQP